jgi:hypothetical protein
MPFLIPTIVAVGLHIGSYHESPGFNNANPGIFFRTENDYIIGAYYNSVENPTVYVVKDIKAPGRLDHFSVAVGLATGYQYAPLTPVATFNYRFDNGFGLTHVPHVAKINNGAVYHLTYSRGF